MPMWNRIHKILNCFSWVCLDTCYPVNKENLKESNLSILVVNSSIKRQFQKKKIFFYKKLLLKMRPKLLTKCPRKSLSDKFYPNLEICIEMYVGYILTDLYMLLCYFYIVPYWLWDVKVCFVVYIQTFHEYLQGKVKLMKI